MARNFSSARIITGSGSAAAPAYGTLVSIFRVTGSGGANGLVVVNGQGRSFGMYLAPTSNALALTTQNSGDPIAPTITVGTGDDWVLCAITKATGSVAPRFHKYAYATNTWSHENYGSNVVNVSGGTQTGWCIGAYSNTGFYSFLGDIAAAAVFKDRALSDDQLESLPFSLQSWVSLAPSSLWVLDQQATGQSVLDWTGGGANQSAITGTTVSTSSVPILGYGHPVVPVARFTPPATPYIRSGTGATALGASGTCTLTIPTSVVVDDVMVMSAVFKVATGTDTIQTPTGWTQDVAPVDGTGATFQAARYIKTAVSGDIGAAVTIRGVTPAAQQINVAFGAYANADPAPRSTALADNGSTSSTSVTAASATTSAGDLVVYTGGVRSSLSGPAGQPTLTGPGFLRSQSTGTSGGSQNVAAFLGDNDGATGSRTITASQSSWSIAGQLVLKSLASGATANAGAADVGADAYSATADTASNVSANAGQADVAATADTASAVAFCVASAGVADAAADAHNATAATVAATTALAGAAPVDADAHNPTTVTTADTVAGAAVANVTAAAHTAAGIVPHLFTTQTPAAANNNDGVGIVVATSVQFTIGGYLTGVRFYTSTTVSGTYTVALWQVTAGDSPGPGAGTLLASKTVAGSPAAGGWNIQAFDTPVAVIPGVLYRVGLHNTDGRYVSTGNVFQNPLVNGQIIAEAHGQDPVGAGTLSQGTYEYSPGLTYPDGTFNQLNYFVDVDFALDAPTSAVAAAGVAAVAADGGGTTAAVSVAAGAAGVGSDALNASITLAIGAGPASVTADVTNAAANTSASATAGAGPAEVAADAYNPAAAWAVAADAGQATGSADAYGAAAVTVPAVTADAGFASAAVAAQDATVTASAAIAAGDAAVSVAGYNPAVAVDSNAPADVAAAGAVGYVPAVSVAVSAGQADVTTAGQGATVAAASTASADVAVTDVSSANPAVSTSSSITVPAGVADVGVDGLAPSQAAGQPAGQAQISADTYPATTVTLATGTGLAGVADVTTDAFAATGQPVLMVPAGQSQVGADGYGATALTSATADALALTAQATAQAFNALVVLGVASSSADVAVEAFDVPKKRVPGLLTAGAARLALTAGTTRSRLIAGTTRGPTVGGGG